VAEDRSAADFQRAYDERSGRQTELFSAAAREENPAARIEPAPPPAQEQGLRAVSEPTAAPAANEAPAPAPLAAPAPRPVVVETPVAVTSPPAAAPLPPAAPTPVSSTQASSTQDS